MLKNIFIIISCLFYCFLITRVEQADRIIFMDVGAGDSTLIQHKGKNIIVDGGPSDNLLYKLKDYGLSIDPHFDHVFLTHYHDDHYSGLMELTNRYEIGELVTVQRCDHNDRFKRLGFPPGLKITQVQAGDQITVNNDLVISIVYPIGGTNGQCVIPNITNENDNSLVTLLQVNEANYLLMGDAEKRAEHNIIQSFNFSRVDVLKAGHHCSKTSNSRSFVKAIDPRLIICSTSKDNKFGHPSQEVVDMFIQEGYEYFVTYQEGDVIIPLIKNK